MSPNAITTRLRALLPSRSDFAAVKRTWRMDLLAGLTVGIVALPLALAFGVSSGVGAEAGLITAVVAGVVAAVFGGSPVQVSGPTGAMVVVLVPLVAAHGSGSVIIVGALAGVTLIIAAALGFGRLIGFIPWPVIEGFTTGIAVIIFLQQIPAAVGVAHTSTSSIVVSTFTALSDISFDMATVQSLGLAALVVAVMAFWPIRWRRVPASIVAIVGVTAVSASLNWGVARIGEIPSSLPGPTFPTVSLELVSALVPAVLSVAALAGIESLLSARVAMTMSASRDFDPDRELVGQGLASIASSIFGGMPATGAIARTAVNVKSGARSRLASITHAAVVLIVIYFGAPLVAHIPLAALAGVLMVTAVRMLPLGAAREILRSTKPDAVIFVSTVVVTVAFDLIDAVLLGIAATAFVALRNLVKTSGVHREEIPAPHDPLDAHISIFRLDGALFFGAVKNIEQRLERIDDVRVVIIRMAGLQFLDATGAHVLAEISAALEKRGIHVVLKGIQLEHRRLIDKLGLPAGVEVTETLTDALVVARRHLERGGFVEKVTNPD